MTEPVRLFILAGEPSGDALAADLVRRLRTKTQVSLTGVGGPELAAEGLSSIFPMSDLSVMGWADVLPRLPLLLWRARQVANAIIRDRPDGVVLVDAQVFSRTVARRVRRAGVKTPILLYVAPSAWAWGPERARALTGLFDEILGILPFEPKAFADMGGPLTTFVGHPAAGKLMLRTSIPRSGPLLLLPGSRNGELRRHLPIMREVAAALQGHPRVTGFVMPTLSSLEGKLKDVVRGWPAPIDVVSGPDARTAAFSTAVAAVAVTGTITLELAMAGVPMVTTYVGDRQQVKRVVDNDIRFVSLPNLVLGRGLVPEELFADPDPEIVIARVRGLLDQPQRGDDQLAGFREIRELMISGAPDAPRTDPAERVVARLQAWRDSMGS
jgi:lipid-A-disaccharide synthase